MSGASGDSLTDLSQLGDKRLAEIFEQQGDDPNVLEALNHELKKRDSDQASELHMEVAKARFSKSASVATDPITRRPRSSLGEWIWTFLNARRLAEPDQRPLYRYRMTDGEYEDAKGILRQLAATGRLANPDRHSGAMFVSFGAEWFRRESNSTFHRWDDLAPDIFPWLAYSNKQQLTLLGLKFWRRELRRGPHGREFLLTLALEGGFPVRILAEGERGWLKDYLRIIMRRAIASKVSTEDEVLAIAEEERGRMRKGYQRDEFVALCSELAESLLLLRHIAENEGAPGVRNTLMLDAKCPGWREELPIYLPAEDEALAAELLTGLLNERMSGPVTHGVEVRRYLVKRGGEWLPAVQILADGEIQASKLPELSGQSRARVIPMGELGNHLTGELALMEPPVGEPRLWRVRPFARTGKLLTGFPFSAPVNTTVTSPDHAPCHWTWPGGEALRSDILVFQQDEGSTPQEPLLRFLRAGSVSSPAKTLYALVPAEWIVEPSSETSVTETLISSLGRRLVCVAGATYFSSGDFESSRFKVEPDTDGVDRDLEISSVTAAEIDLADDRCELVPTPAYVRIREQGRQPRPPVSGELFVRCPGGKWGALSGPLQGVGLIELSWRDPTANFQIEKRLLALVPGGARISGVLKDAVSGELRLQGLAGWSASLRDADCTVGQADASTLWFRFAGRPTYRLPMRLRPPAGPALEVVVSLVGRNAAIALANSSLVTPGSRIDFSSLRGALAISPHRKGIHLAPKGAKSTGLRTDVDGELPLGTLRSSIDEMLATLPGQDDLVELEFIGDNRPPIRISRYRLDKLTIEAGIVRYSLPTNSLRAVPVAKMILDPRREHALEPESDGRWRIPERCKGLCIIYLRDGVDVVSRPVPIMRPGMPAMYGGDLVSTLTIADFNVRQREIAAALSKLARVQNKSDDLTWLLDVATNLNGLPPSAFDALKLLPSNPEALVCLLLNARDAEEQGTVWSLQNELPFLWLGLPMSAWQSALQNDYISFAQALKDVFGPERAAGEAAARLRRLRDELTELEPALEKIFGLAGLSGTDLKNSKETPSLSDLTNGYIVSQSSRSDEPQNDYADRLRSKGLRLPGEIETKSHADFAGLFAPVLLAASARGRISLDREMALLARRTLREDPAYVSMAWRRLVDFYS
ncbi:MULTISPECIES: STY4851/ECs_5259 family protein [unclassified Bradyrhizobium]|uniref:STY4851/ECs_5259 family protein n=1 Tax=Bradyrhizobium TaxID=374 RepID=UPI0028E45B19|nr:MULTISPECIES: STY4851/ECs_5259 family protein [unclassified Bradyrhizobium]